MFENRKKHFAVVLVAAVAVAGYLTYHKYLAPDQPVAETEVKAAAVIADAAKPARYSDQEAGNHLSLTPSNVVWFTNYYRVKNGVAPMLMNDALNRSAYRKNLDMLQYDYFAHERHSGDTSRNFSNFIDDQHYDFIKVGENLARGDFETSRDVVEAWMNSESHRRNILDPGYAEIGVAINPGTFAGVQTMLFTQHFGFPRKNCPSVSGSVRDAINALRDQIDELDDAVRDKELEIGGLEADDAGYNERVAEYNTLVQSYNGFINQLQSLIATYNSQVQKYESCAKGSI